MTSTELAPLGTGFTTTQRDMLQAPLNADHVKEREQGGRKLSYVEGWYVIGEANRVFGFEGWTRETTEIKCVAEHARKMGRPPNQRDGWGVSYIAKVRVIVRAGVTPVVREGIGSGHGIDADCGLAHESAIKEAETDAMKRALVTFGNPFGLALYDKSHANVKRLPKKNAGEIYTRLQDEIRSAPNHAALKAWGEENKERINIMPEDWQEILRSMFAERIVGLRQIPQSKPEAAAQAADETPEHDEDGVIWDDPPETDAGQSKWAAMSPVQQAGIRCGDPAFWKFATAHMGKEVGSAVEAAGYVRAVCNINSRALLSTDEQAAAKWRKLDTEFIAWKHDPSPTSARNAEQPAPSRAVPLDGSQPESGAGDLPDDSRARFIEATRDHIKRATDYQKLGEWWNSAEQKQARRDFELNAEQVKELTAFVLARLEALKPKTKAS
jgi:DNA recombination protein Rad52